MGFVLSIPAHPVFAHWTFLNLRWICTFYASVEAILSLCSAGCVSVQGLLHTELIAARINGTSPILLAYQGV